MMNLRQRVAAYFGLFVAYVSPVNNRTWDILQQNIRRRFPGVRQISSQELNDWLADDNRRPHPLLIDVRQAGEFAISHLRGARNVTSVREVRALVGSAEQPIVLYCSVGYRASALAEKLQQAGVTSVWNLDGAIFAWASEGRPVVRGSNLLKPPSVHPHGGKWGQLLRPELRGPLP